MNSPESFLPEDQTGRLAVFEQMRSDLEASVELREDETGEAPDPLTAIEYAIIAASVAVAIILALNFLGVSLSDVFDVITAELDPERRCVEVGSNCDQND